jgi:hypothetical protein
VVEVEKRYERVDEEVVGEEEEPVEDRDSYEVAGEDEEVVEEGEEVVATPAPSGGEAAVEAYIWGIGSPPKPNLSAWLYAVQELKRLLAWKEKGAKVEKLDERLARARRAVFYTCTERASGNCPIYNLSVKSCAVNLEAICRPIAWGKRLAERRRVEKPRKWRRWYQ